MDIKEYLNTMVAVTKDEQQEYYKWLLDNGTTFTQKDLDIELSTKYATTSQTKACFKNSLLNTFANSDLDYYEGFYLWDNTPFAMEHAFNVNSKTNKLVDSTAMLLNYKDLKQWFGIKIPQEFAFDEQFMTLQKYYLKTLKEK